MDVYFYQAGSLLALDARLAVLRLLDGVDKFVGQECAACGGLGGETACAEDDMIACRVGQCAVGSSGDGRRGVVVNADMSKVGAEPMGHFRMERGVERAAGTERRVKRGEWSYGCGLRRGGGI